MKPSLARQIIILSLVLSLLSFILSLIACLLPNWKYVQLRGTSQSALNSETNQIDPLIRSEVDKYYDTLYRPGEIHSYGLLNQCIVGRECGQNRLPSFHDQNYELCHSIKFHHECIFANSLTSLKKCACQKPSYLNTTHILIILVCILQILFISINLLRLYCRFVYQYDIQYRLITILASLFSVLFLFIIIIQQNANRLNEPLEFFNSMHRHYLRVQIYKFSNDLEWIIKEVQQDLDVDFGASYICIIFILIFTLICFVISSTIEVKNVSKFDDDMDQSDEEKVYKQSPILIEDPPNDDFIPFEQIRFTRQTKV